MCHNKETTGARHKVWTAGPHAKAFETLAGEKAKAQAKELGIDDAQKSEKCLKCHATAVSVMAGLADQEITMEEGVSRESRHGPGSIYYKKKVMAAITAGTTPGKSVGLIDLSEKVCKQCHTAEGNANYIEPKFTESSKKIAHRVPAAK